MYPAELQTARFHLPVAVLKLFEINKIATTSSFVITIDAVRVFRFDREKCVMFRETVERILQEATNLVS